MFPELWQTWGLFFLLCYMVQTQLRRVLSETLSSAAGFWQEGFFFPPLGGDNSEVKWAEPHSQGESFSVWRNLGAQSASCFSLSTAIMPKMSKDESKPLRRKTAWASWLMRISLWLGNCAPAAQKSALSWAASKAVWAAGEGRILSLFCSLWAHTWSRASSPEVNSKKDVDLLEKAQRRPWGLEQLC